MASPGREDLDRIVPDRPVFLPNRDGHDAWVNTKALELAGITRDTPDPADGRIARDPDGTPLGTLHEGAQALVTRLVPPATAGGPAARPPREPALPPLARDHRLAGRLVRPADDQAAYLALAGRGELTARVVGALWWDRDARPRADRRARRAPRERALPAATPRPASSS